MEKMYQCELGLNGTCQITCGSRNKHEHGPNRMANFHCGLNDVDTRCILVDDGIGARLPDKRVPIKFEGSPSAGIEHLVEHYGWVADTKNRYTAWCMTPGWGNICVNPITILRTSTEVTY